MDDMQQLLDRMEQHSQLQELREINSKLPAPVATQIPEPQVTYIAVPSQTVYLPTGDSGYVGDLGPAIWGVVIAASIIYHAIHKDKK